jgi:hypothetical protein
MSARALNWAFDQRPKTTSQKLVLLTLADRADEDGLAYPSVDWISKKCAPMPYETARRVIRELAEQGLVEKVRRLVRKDGTFGAWLFRLPIDQRSSVTGGDLQWEDETTGHQRTLGQRSPVTEPAVTHARADSRLDPNKPSSGEEGARAIQISIDRAVREAIYGDADVKLTDREARKVALAATSIRKAGGTPQDVHDRCEAYRKHKTYGQVALTAPSLAEHWSELATPAKKRSAAKPCEECGTGGGHHQSDCSRAKAA